MVVVRFAACALLMIALVSGQDIKIQFLNNGSNLILSVGDEEWFRSGPLNVRFNGQLWSSSNTDQYFINITNQTDDTGEDSAGSFSRKEFVWQAYEDNNTPSNVTVKTEVSLYDGLPIVVFDIVYTNGLTQAADPKNDKGSLSSFPSFVFEPGKVERGWMTWAHVTTSNVQFGKWGKDQVYGDLDGGFPLVVFDSAMEAAVVISPLNSFMAASQTTIMDQATNEAAITLGPLSSIDTVPEMYRFRTVMVAGGNVTDAMRKFGEFLRTLYKKDGHYREKDFCLNYLGYWTDNGACYYYYTGKNYTNYEDVLVAVKEDADKNMIPYRYVQLDSWWYYKGQGEGVKNWTARPDIFPNGIESMVAKTGWPVVAHNRFWSTNTDYAKKFKFIIDENGAVPVDPAFWNYLFSDPVEKWRLIVYEQDWLSSEMGKVKQLESEIDLGMQWLDDMGMAAQRYGLTIQYCMPWPRHILQSVTIPAVTHSRVSHDYGPNNDQWIVGDSTILAHAVGLAAFKDTFRSSSDQVDCASKYKSNETAPVLETYVAAFAGGPVGPSDQIGTADAQLLMATCMPDGRLLKATHPAMSLDSTFLQRALGNKGPNGQMTAAYTEVSGHSWYYVMAADLKEDYTMAISELPSTSNTFPRTEMQAVAFWYDFETGRVSAEQVSEDSVIKFSKCSKTDFKHVVIAPILPNGVALFGELNKFITVSKTRFVNIDVDGADISVSFTGNPSEKVSLTLYTVEGKTISTVDCIVGVDGYAKLTVGSDVHCT